MSMSLILEADHSGQWQWHAEIVEVDPPARKKQAYSKPYKDVTACQQALRESLHSALTEGHGLLPGTTESFNERTMIHIQGERGLTVQELIDQSP